jgi:hypothetical protein
MGGENIGIWRFVRRMLELEKVIVEIGWLNEHLR